MSKDPSFVNPLIQQEFTEFGRSVIDHFISTCPSHIDPEPDVLSSFVANNVGKKSKSYIDGVCSDYADFKAGRMDTKRTLKFLKNSMFVKFENNAKFVSGNVVNKPRMIMTMCDLNLVEFSPVLNLIHAWNASDFSRFQVKEMEPEEMIDKITGCVDRPHTVTDYSAYEASLDEALRSLEHYMMDKLCDRYSYDTLKKRLKSVHKGRMLHCKYGQFYITTRCSGDYWTSTGNGLLNVLVAMFCLHKKGVSLANILNMPMIAEGDDGICPAGVLDQQLVSEVGLTFSSEVSGTSPGDTDFLRALWLGGKRYLNVGRCLSSLWVKNGCRLKKSKQLYILRCIGASLHHLSPGHPVLFEVVNYIGRVTAGTTDFKNSELYLDKWKKQDKVSKYPRNVVCDETMRPLVAKGAIGFPPISIAEQLCLERCFREASLGSIYIGRLLDDFPEVKVAVACGNGQVQNLDFADQYARLIDLLNNTTRGKVIHTGRTKDDVRPEIMMGWGENSKIGFSSSNPT